MVVFDIGGVLEHIDDPGLTFEPKWRDRLGLSAAEFTAAMNSVDPGRLTRTGEMNEAQYRERCAAALGLSDGQVQEFMADTWDLYCGELNVELHAYAASLRPRFRTAILSNSADGARREEQARFDFEHDFDPIIYSHEVGLAKPDPAIFELTWTRIGVAPEEMIFIDNVPGHVDAASKLGIHAILHRSTPATIAAISSLLLP